MSVGPLVISLVGYALIGLFGRNTGAPGDVADIVLGLGFGLVSLVWYFVVVVQQARAVVGNSRSLRRQSDLSAAILLFVAYPFVAGLLLYAFYEADPGAFQEAAEPSFAIARVIRFFALASLVQNGTGFTVVGPVVWYSELALSLVGKFYALVNILVVSVVIGRALSHTQGPARSRRK